MQSCNEQLPLWGSRHKSPTLFSHLFPIWPTLSSRHLLGEEPGNTFWVAINCVEEPWEGEAEYGSQEEQSNNHFLLHRCYKGHVWPEHVEDSQTKEEDASWKTVRQKGVKLCILKAFLSKTINFNVQEHQTWELHDNQQHTCRIMYCPTSVIHSNHICVSDWCSIDLHRLHIFTCFARCLTTSWTFLNYWKISCKM